jgi:hypothetical protein
MSSSGFRSIVSILNLFPLLGVKIEAVKIVEGDSGIVQATMTSEHIDLVFK